MEKTNPYEPPAIPSTTDREPRTHERLTRWWAPLLVAILGLILHSYGVSTWLTTDLTPKPWIADVVAVLATCLGAVLYVLAYRSYRKSYDM